MKLHTSQLFSVRGRKLDQLHFLLDLGAGTGEGELNHVESQHVFEHLLRSRWHLGGLPWFKQIFVKRLKPVSF
jgi:hypothetical protein